MDNSGQGQNFHYHQGSLMYQYEQFGLALHLLWESDSLAGLQMVQREYNHNLHKNQRE